MYLHHVSDAWKRILEFSSLLFNRCVWHLLFSFIFNIVVLVNVLFSLTYRLAFDYRAHIPKRVPQSWFVKENWECSCTRMQLRNTSRKEWQDSRLCHHCLTRRSSTGVFRFVTNSIRRKNAISRIESIDFIHLMRFAASLLFVLWSILFEITGIWSVILEKHSSVRVDIKLWLYSR